MFGPILITGPQGVSTLSTSSPISADVLVTSYNTGSDNDGISYSCNPIPNAPNGEVLSAGSGNEFREAIFTPVDLRTLPFTLPLAFPLKLSQSGPATH
jgi:hypothetical protein